MRSGSLVRFERRFEEGSADGYVLGLGRELFLLALVGEHIRFNGFQALRIVDVRKLRPHPFAPFVESALKKRREHKPRKLRVSVRSLRALLLSASKCFPLITIHCERVDADVCHIGRLVSVGRKNLALLEIGPGAVWDDAPTQYVLKQVTRVDFGAITKMPFTLSAAIRLLARSALQLASALPRRPRAGRCVIRNGAQQSPNPGI